MEETENKINEDLNWERYREQETKDIIDEVTNKTVTNKKNKELIKKSLYKKYLKNGNLWL